MTNARMSSWRFIIFLPLILSFIWALLNHLHKVNHPNTPNYDARVFGGMLGAISVLMGVFRLFFERRPRFREWGFERIVTDMILLLGGFAATVLNGIT